MIIYLSLFETVDVKSSPIFNVFREENNNFLSVIHLIFYRKQEKFYITSTGKSVPI